MTCTMLSNAPESWVGTFWALSQVELFNEMVANICRSLSWSCDRWFHDSVTFMALDVLANAYPQFNKYNLLHCFLT